MIKVMLARVRMMMKLAVMLASLTLEFALAGELLVNRHFKGDIFSQKDCESKFCDVAGVSHSPLPLTSPLCTCQCDTQWPTFREDRKVCVDSLHECEQADFVTGSSTEKIPFVYLPLSGQLVYPSASISIPTGGSELGLGSPICVVSTIEILTTGGWVDMTNFTKDFQKPFQLYSEKDKTYLQWMGKETIHKVLEGRLMLIHLLCKDTAQQSTRLFAPCISFRVAGSPGIKVNQKTEVFSESLTERDYLAIGVCVGFLFMLYVFAMIVFIVIKKKQKRDKRLREQFLQLPIPQGIGYKSSRILGLEESYLTDIARLANEARQSQRIKNGAKCELHKTCQGNGKCLNNPGTNISEHNEKSLKVNEHLLNVHQKQVENQLQLEIARTVHCCEIENVPDSSVETMTKLNMTINGKNMVKRFFPNLEEIPEESRNNTLKNLSIKEDSLDECDCSDSSNLSSMELQDLGISTSGENSQGSTGRSNFYLQSMDSGIVTRSTSPTPDQRSDNDVYSSHDVYSDNETVDVADSYSDDTNSDKDVNQDLQEDNQELSITKFGSHTVGCKNNLDFLSEIYNTAFSKLPKVLNSDTSSDYSYYSSTTTGQSTADKEILYDSLNFKYKENKLNDSINQTSTFRKSIDEANLIYEEIGDNQHASEVFIVSNDDSLIDKTKGRNDKTKSDIKYSSGEKMMISISHDNENVYSDKLLIAVNGNDKHDEVVRFEDSNSYDPDTLERNLDKSNEHEKFKLDVEDTLHDQAVVIDEKKINLYSLYTPVIKNGYSFHLRTDKERVKNNIENIFNKVPEQKQIRSDLEELKCKNGSENPLKTKGEVSHVKFDSDSFQKSIEDSEAPILPPKRRNTPKLPPKPFLQALNNKQRLES